VAARSTAAARWRSASRSGAGLSRIPPTTSSFAPGSSSDCAPAGRRVGSDDREARGTALGATGRPRRQTLYQQIQRALNARGPYFPLIQPTQVFVTTKDLKNSVYNAVYSLDVTQVAPT
jgi:peptide/nickel transport system substrate-binding protein